MAPNDPKSITYFMEASPSDSATYWGLSQRMEENEKKTRELSTQSERQLLLMEKIDKSHSELMSKLLEIIEKNEETIKGLQSQTESLTVNQNQLGSNQQELITNQLKLHENQEQLQKNQEYLHTNQQQLAMNHEQNIQALKAEVEVLNGQFRAMQDQQHGQRALRNVSDLEEPDEDQGAAITDDADDNENPMTAPRGVIFTDSSGRKRRCCKLCGKEYGASYCVQHERERVCLRRRRRRLNL